MINVIKRNGTKEPLNLNKFHKMVEYGCQGITAVSISEIELQSQIQFYDGIKTTEIQETLIKAAAELITEDTPNYQYVAGRFINYNLRKDVYNNHEPTDLYTHVNNVISSGYYDPDILTYYTVEEFEEIDSFIDHHRDLSISYIGMEQFRGKYLIKNRVTKQFYETPQMAFILIPMILFRNYPKETRIKWVRDFYDALSTFEISLPTPIMGGLRSTQKQFSSCVLIETDDSLDSINATTSAIVKYVSQKAGIGIGGGRIRSIGSPIRNGDASHTGVIPFYKLFQSAVKSCCVTPESWVEVLEKMKTKKIQIKDLCVGMKVKTLDPLTGMILFKEVTDKWNTIVPKNDQRKIIFNNGTKLCCSINHPIMVKKDNKIVEILPDNLSTFDNVVTENGISHISSVSIVDKDENYIDITVDDLHTFFVADDKNEEMILTHNSQGGIRGGSATLYYPIWHAQIDDMLVLKNNKGVEENRIRHLDYGVQFNKVMYERLLSGGNITLFSPHDVPEMYEAFFVDTDKFRSLYEKAESDPKIKKKSIPAIELFSQFIQERKDTGRIYLMNVDHVNDHGAFKKESAPIHMSNLCGEIALPTKPLKSVDDEDGEISLCTLAAVNWGKIRNPEDFKKPCELIVRALDELLDYQDYPVKAAKNSTMNRRPLGVGIINFAYWLAKNDFTYSNVSDQALAKIHQYAEAWSYYLIKTSVELAKEKGQCPLSYQTKYHDEILPIDTYKKDVDSLTPPLYNMNWDQLKNDLKVYGIRNSTLMALMPSETSASISNSTNGIEPVRSLITIKQSKDGVLKQVVPEIRRLKNKYDLLWEQSSPEGYLKICAVLQKFIDQAISVNTSYNPRNYDEEKISMSDMIKDIVNFYRYGGKCLYYFNTMDGAGGV